MTKRKPQPRAPDEETLSEEETRSFSGWKFDLMETMNADPVFNGSDCKIVEAYLHFANARTKRAYLSIIGARVRTGLSQPTITASLARLQDFGVFVARGRTSGGCVWFEIRNVREGHVLEHMRMSQEFLKEADARRKVAERERQIGARVRKETLVRRGARPQENFGDSTKDSYDKHPEGTPVSGLGTDRGASSGAPPSNAYARAKGGF